MKFIVKNIAKCAPRRGIIEKIKRLPEKSFETPMVMLYTKGGSVPHLTREVLHMVTKEPQSIQVPIVSTASFFEPLSEYEGTLADFVGLKEYLTYVTIQDPAELTPQGHHLQNNIPIWTKSGKLYMNSDSYMQTIESFKPDLYCILADGDTDKSSSKKRISKAVDQSLSLFDSCLERHKTSDKLQNSLIIAAIEGGYCLHSRERCVKGLLKNVDNIGGFLIDGLHINGPEVELLQYEDIKEVLEKTIDLLPSEKMRIIQGCWNPLVILKLVSAGIDIFDTSYVYTVTERNSALTFNFDINVDENTNELYEIDFKHKSYAEDLTPILKDCKCPTCLKYTRAYIHHLINVQELLGPILLHMHNLHHYLEFFKKIREAIDNNCIEKLTNLISSQVNKHFKTKCEITINQ